MKLVSKLVNHIGGENKITLVKVVQREVVSVEVLRGPSSNSKTLFYKY